MDHNQIGAEQDEVANLYEDKLEIRCPFCDNIITIKPNTNLEDVICPECKCKPSEYQDLKNSRPIGGA